jgi:hypothetical protein
MRITIACLTDVGRSPIIFMTRMKAILLVLVVSISLAGCNKNAPSHSNPVATPPSPPKKIVVKGLYVGMSVQELAQAVSTKFGAGWECKPNIFNTYYIREIGRTWSGSQFDNYVYLWHDDSGTVMKITFGKICSPRIFNAADLSAEDFAQTFITAYDIPKLRPNGEWWEYTTPDNVRIRISGDKAVEIQKAATEQQRRSNFN